MNQTGGTVEKVGARCRRAAGAQGCWVTEVLFGYATGCAFPTLRGHPAGSPKVPAEVFLKWLLPSLFIQLNSEWMTFPCTLVRRRAMPLW